MPTTARRLKGPSATRSSDDNRRKIIELNDQLRSSFKGGRVQMTRGVYDLDARLRGRALDDESNGSG